MAVDPTDPGAGPGSSTNYGLDAAGEVRCLIHGAVIDPSAEARPGGDRR